MQRKLHSDLKDFLTAQIGFQPDEVSLFIAAASACVGIMEEKENRGKYIDLFQQTTGAPLGSPWCMSFVQSLVAFIENRAGENKLPAGAGCVDVYTRAPDSMKVVDPKRGDLIVWQNVGSNAGHVGIITRVGTEFYATIEGNTSNGKGINRDGDGIYSRQRSKKPAGALQILGFLRLYPTVSRVEKSA